MKSLLLSLMLLLLLGASHCWAAQYFVSPSGSDSNNGTSSGTPWLSPNHALNCGDVVTAASGTYSTSNFTSGKWGTVTCAGNNNVAWLVCSTFDTCKISSTTADAMWVDKSYWGVVGWEASTNGSSNNEAACFRITPSGSYILHHVVFADDIANGCQGGGFEAYNTSSTAGEDYISVIGSIAYNAAQGAGECFSGISFYQPINQDTTTGTHLFVSGNFAWGNVDPGTCAGGPSTDGEAVIIDTPDHSQGGFGNPFIGQIVVNNNVGFYNGGRGFEIYNNQSGTTHALAYFEHNTSFGNSTDLNQTNGCFDRGELFMFDAKDVTWLDDLAMTRNGTSCSAEPLYGFIALSGDATSNISNSAWAGIGGHNTDPNTSSSVLGTGNTIGTNPAFANPVNPGAPSCGSFSSVATCMAAVIADYVPSAVSTSLGYQPPSNTSVTDPLFPSAYLCTGTAILNPNIPVGLVAPGCGTSGSVTLVSIALTGTAADTVGLTTQLTATGTYSNSTTANITSASTWVSNATGVCTVTSGGLVKGVAAGTCGITATDSGVSNSPAYSIIVSAASGGLKMQGAALTGGSTQ